MTSDPNTICPNCCSDIDSLIHTVIVNEGKLKSDEIECKVCGYRW